eukprot:972062-Prymnesium_polylepis.1
MAERVLASKRLLLERSRTAQASLRDAIDAATRAEAKQREREAVLTAADDAAAEAVRAQAAALHGAEGALLRLTEVLAAPAHAESAPVVLELLGAVGGEDGGRLGGAER